MRCSLLTSLGRVRRAALAVILSAGGGLYGQTRLADLSTLGQVGTGSNIMISGFVVGAGTGETVLIRAVGPTLATAPYNVAGVLPDPLLTLSQGANELATNSSWKSSDAATMASVAAFPLVAGSKDAAIVTTLPAGTYTAEVAGATGDTGAALLEVYEVGPNAASSRLLNLSTRLQVGAGTPTLSGLVIAAGSGSRTLLVRAVGPTLAGFNIAGTLADPNLSVLSGGAVIASNDNWGTPVGVGAASAATLSAAFTQAGAFALAAGSLDSALIVTLAPGSYSVQVTGNNGGSGIAMVEVYDITPANAATTVSIVATSPNADTSGDAGVFTVTRTGDTTLPLTVPYTVGGTAVSGMDYQTLSGSVTIPAGASSATIVIAPNSSLSAATTTVTLTLTSNSAYAIGTPTDTVTITNIPPTLYVANLAPVAAATGSTAYGIATIALAANGSSATVNISYSNLTSAEQAPHLTIGVPGAGNNFVFNLDYPGQVVNQVWNFAATGTYSSFDLLNALKTGNIYVEIGSATYQTGELTGQFIQAAGSQTFSAPGTPPVINLNNPSQTDAARFLAQATFGPTSSDITNVVTVGYSQWLTNEMALPETSHLAATRADAAAFPNTGQYPVTPNDRQAAWWKLAVTAPDQLRQRVGFALSEIFVVSDVASTLAEQPEALANYYDMLASDAFGNYRQLLQDVTLSPVMGNYLNMLRNAAANPAKGTSADENYAREVMQLFTIGLNLLNPDGTLRLDSFGQPIPTYTNTTIVQTANVFTGWAYHSTAASPSFSGGAADWYNPMMLYPAYHDNTQKTVVGGVVIPANEGGTADLKLELDALFNHQNTGPFICRELIQRLVTSNPSPGYIYRVAQVFANDGTGTRGNLAAVVKAILLDYEARSPGMVTSNASYGKLKEPLLRQTSLYRAFNANSLENRFPIFTPDQNLGQAALRSPTVFNFFLPNYVPSGSLAAAGLFGPEFQITTAATAITVANTFYSAVYTSATPSASTVTLDLSALTAAPDLPTMVNLLNLLLCGGNLSGAAQQQILASLQALPTSTTALAKAQFALELVVTATAGAIQQ